jgi:TrmH family RNA methyltransferase
MPTEILTSAANPLLKTIRRAVVRGRLTEDGHCVAEGFHLLEEALRSDCRVRIVLVAESLRESIAAHVKGLKGVRVVSVPRPLLEHVASTETTQGVIALVEPPSWTLEQALRGHTLVMVLDGIQEPGNAGAMLRSAEAFGASGAVFLKGSVHPFNPKSVRASAGSIFRLPCVYGVEGALLRAALDHRRVQLFAATPSAGVTPRDADLTGKCAIVIGSEGRGISAELERNCSPLRIPTARVESLNAAVAAGILLYEAQRQRQMRGS